MTHKFKKLAFLTLLMAAGTASFAQMKIGGTPGAADSSAYLQLGNATGADKGFLNARVSLTSTATWGLAGTTPVDGMHVYNTATAGTGSTQVTPGEYYWSSGAWVRINTSNSTADLLGSGAPSGTAATGTKYTDTLSSSTTVGRQWTYNGSAWVAYTPPASTEWYAVRTDTTKSDAGGNKDIAIWRNGHVSIGPNPNNKRISPAHLQINDYRYDYAAITLGPDSTDAFIIAKENGAGPFNIYEGKFSSPTGGKPRFTIAPGGNVGIGTMTPGFNLQVLNSFFCNSTGTVPPAGGIASGTTPVEGIEMGANAMAIHKAGGPAMYLTKVGGDNGSYIQFKVSGNLVGEIACTNGTTTTYSTSDVRLKENVVSTKYGLTDVMKMGIYDYNYKIDEKKGLNTGVLAQDLYKVYPGAVKVGGENAQTDPWMVDYTKLVPVLVKAIQDQQAEIQELQKEIDQLKNK